MASGFHVLCNSDGRFPCQTKRRRPHCGSVEKSTVTNTKSFVEPKRVAMGLQAIPVPPFEGPCSWFCSELGLRRHEVSGL